jgi:hypothetical protein
MVQNRLTCLNLVAHPYLASSYLVTLSSLRFPSYLFLNGLPRRINPFVQVNSFLSHLLEFVRENSHRRNNHRIKAGKVEPCTLKNESGVSMARTIAEEHFLNTSKFSLVAFFRVSREDSLEGAALGSSRKRLNLPLWDTKKNTLGSTRVEAKNL